MATTYPLRIVTHEEIVIDQEVESLVVPAARGYLGVLAHHAPLLTTLSQGKITLRDAKGDEQHYQVNGGILEVANGTATILTEDLK